jgi:hypothetical protein
MSEFSLCFRAKPGQADGNGAIEVVHVEVR